MIDNPRCLVCDGPTVYVGKIRRAYSKYSIYECERQGDCSGPTLRRYEQRKARKRSLVAAALFFGASSVNLAIPLETTNEAAYAFLQALTFAFFLLSIHYCYKYYSRRNGELFRKSHYPSIETYELNEENYAYLQRQAMSPQFTTARAQIFTAAVLTPRQFRKRVNESYEVKQRTLHQTISIEARIPTSLLEKSTSGDYLPIYFPVVLPNKGRLQDNFTLFSATGERLNCLAYREYLLLATRTARMLTSYANGGDREGELPPTLEGVATNATKLMAARLYRGKSVGNLDVPSNWIDPLLVDEKDSHTATAKKSLQALVNVLHQHFAIVAIVKPDEFGRVFVKVEQDVVPDLKLDVKARLAITLGARPVHLSVGLEQAATCDSYHLHVGATEDLYLGDQRLESCGKTLNDNQETVPHHVRLKPRLGQSYAHLYARHFPTTAPGERPSLRLQFFERPPGSTLPAAASAFVTFVLVWAIALITKNNPDPTSDAPAWLLAFPALAAAWLGIEAPSGRLLEGTLAARVSLATTISTCVTAGILFMTHNVYNVDDGYTWWSLPFDWSVFWITDISWLALWIVAIFNSTGIIYSYLTRTAYYEYLSSRRRDSAVRQHE